MSKFDQIWISNRFRYRKTLKGTRLVKDPVTGYLEPVGRKGFTAEMRKTFIDRLRVCNNYNQIAKSVGIQIQSFYDAVAVDDKFREEVLLCDKIENRSIQLNNELKQLKIKEKNQTIEDLSGRLGQYGR